MRACARAGSDAAVRVRSPRRAPAAPALSITPKQPTSNRRLLERKELVAHEAHNQARLADRRVAQQHQLEVACLTARHWLGGAGVDWGSAV